MPQTTETALLEALLDSWDRNNRILVNLLGLIPPGGLEVRAAEDSPTVGQMFTHFHYVRLIFLTEDAPDFARPLPDGEWKTERDSGRIAQMLNESAQAVSEAVKNRIATQRAMEMHYDHPILFLQHMMWHEGYHHGQIKLALKLAGRPISDDDAGPLTWDVWMDKTARP
ncbi:MAG TPA: DinB family protein [Bryobacteraceae bacterium]|jgi:uncharacterized damage-inducible protein DinB|nr:DinB family protein [Bryobacteraceae bacterium]